MAHVTLFLILVKPFAPVRRTLATRITNKQQALSGVIVKKQKNLYIYLQDNELRVYSINGPIDHDSADDWLNLGSDACSAGRVLEC